VYVAKNLGAELFVLRVVNEHLAFRSGLYYGKFMAQLEQESAATARHREDGFAERRQARGVGRSGSALAGLIVRAAGEVEVNCIVMGPLRASALLETSTLDHPLSGGACRKVLRHARCSVLVVR
jgi:nucleotide-binding universal stress UspA family protein